METVSACLKLLLKTFLLLFLLIHLSLPTEVKARDMVMVSPRPPETHEGKWFNLIYGEAFRRLGWRLVYKQFPSKRCAYLSNNGEVDGELERVENFNTTYPNLIQVDSPLQKVNFIGIAVAPGFSVNGWESLADQTIRVSYRRGVQRSEVMLPKVISPENLEAVNTVEQGLKKLLLKRTDLYIDIESVIQRAKANESFAQAPIYSAGTLQQVTTYPFLHKKHKTRVAELANILKAMKQEGLFALYWQQAGR